MLPLRECPPQSVRNPGAVVEWPFLEEMQELILLEYAKYRLEIFVGNRQECVRASLQRLTGGFAFFEICFHLQQRYEVLFFTYQSDDLEYRESNGRSGSLHAAMTGIIS